MMFQWAFDLLFPNYDPPPPRENVMRMAHDVVKFNRRAMTLEKRMNTVLSLLNDSVIPVDQRVNAAKTVLTFTLSDSEKIE